jgi:RNA polymerase sigma-70 factor (ECF subfamily)
MPDDELIVRFQQTADPECFAELFARHRRQVYYACKGFFSDGSAAEDATQETFLRAYQNIHRFAGGNFGSWLMRIARNICIDTWRGAREETTLEDTAEHLSSGEALDETSEMRFAFRTVLQEMQTLPQEQRRCVELKMEGYSYEETAASTGLSVQAVKSHLQNGRRNLWVRMKGTLGQLK